MVVRPPTAGTRSACDDVPLLGSPPQPFAWAPISQQAMTGQPTRAEGGQPALDVPVSAFMPPPTVLVQSKRGTNNTSQLEKRLENGGISDGELCRAATEVHVRSSTAASHTLQRRALTTCDVRTGLHPRMAASTQPSPGPDAPTLPPTPPAADPLPGGALQPPPGEEINPEVGLRSDS